MLPEGFAEALDPSWSMVTVRLLGAGGLAGLVGLERELDGHEAGFRTHLLVSLGAAVFGVISVGAFSDFVGTRADSNVQVDVSRVASYVAAGIGFIGAGTILKRQGHIKGLTTAASLWVVAGVGLAAGLGLWSAAIVATAIALVALVADLPLNRIARRRRTGRDGLEVVVAADHDPAALLDTLTATLAGERYELRIAADPGGSRRVLVQGPRAAVLRRGAEALAGRADVAVVRYVTEGAAHDEDV